MQVSTVFESDRYFTIWCQFVTHHQLLIRSDKDSRSGLDQNIDLRFSSVEYQELPSSFWGLQVVQTTSQDTAYVTAKLAREMHPTLSIYTLITNDKKFFVVAGKLRIQTNRLHPLETGLVSLERTIFDASHVDEVIAEL